MRWVEMKCKWEVWSVKCEECNVKCEEVVCLTLHCTGVARRSCSWTQQQQFLVVFLKCEVWTVKCEVWNAKSAVWSVDCVVWSVECEVWSVECEACSEKCEVRSGKQVHARAWLEHGACKFYRWERSYIYISLRQLLLRLVWVIIYGNVGDMSRLTQKEHG